jgi:hypothetical protein
VAGSWLDEVFGCDSMQAATNSAPNKPRSPDIFTLLLMVLIPTK